MSNLATANMRRAQRWRREKEATMRDFPEEKISGMLAAIVLISQAKPKPGDEGTCECPVCQDVLSWWWGGPRAIRARCATPDCLAFMS
jgi:hypothetical protein